MDLNNSMSEERPNGAHSRLAVVLAAGFAAPFLLGLAIGAWMF